MKHPEGFFNSQPVEEEILNDKFLSLVDELKKQNEEISEDYEEASNLQGSIMEDGIARDYSKEGSLKWQKYLSLKLSYDEEVLKKIDALFDDNDENFNDKEKVKVLEKVLGYFDGFTVRAHISEGVQYMEDVLSVIFEEKGELKIDKFEMEEKLKSFIVDKDDELNIKNILDFYTDGEIINVQSILDELRSEFEGKNDNEIMEELNLGFRMHDIGKIFVPKALLQAPNKISISQEDVLGDHSLDGYNILTRFNFSDRVRNIALMHHYDVDIEKQQSREIEEKRAIKNNENVPLYIDVVKHFDVYNAMQSKERRPYQSERIGKIVTFNDLKNLYSRPSGLNKLLLYETIRRSHV